MTHIESIKQHIKELDSKLCRGACASQVVMETNCKSEAYNEVLSFIESLEKEQFASETMREKDKIDTAFTRMMEKEPQEINEAIKDYFKGLWPGTETAEQCNTDMHFTPPAIMRLANHFYELGCRHAAVLYDDMEKERQRRQENEPTIKGWVARDKDGSLWFHYSKPRRENDIEKTWWGSDDRTFQLFNIDYQDLKWESEPIEVELPIIRV